MGEAGKINNIGKMKFNWDNVKWYKVIQNDTKILQYTKVDFRNAERQQYDRNIWELIHLDKGPNISGH